ncbi:V-set and immunoglobulin domain-containing protein 10-like 2 [Eleutherodactylus coqui]|uniref:V-set and immunoglobulin domain-containing protein 10-like 2 n=1 Tax=Eleutherodactylus coqui TaxID=57060 RepID=UPI003462021A
MDNRSFTCIASNPISSETSNGVSLNLAGYPDGDIKCLSNSNNEYFTFVCAWENGHPPANVTMTFNGTTETKPNIVFRIVRLNDRIQGSDLTCSGDQLGRTSTCTMTLAPPPQCQWSGGEIAGIVIGTVAVLIILEVIIFITLRQMKKTPQSTVYVNTSGSPPPLQLQHGRTLPRTETSTIPESNYEQLMFKDDAQYHTLVTTFRK